MRHDGAHLLRDIEKRGQIQARDQRRGRRCPCGAPQYQKRLITVRLEARDDFYRRAERDPGAGPHLCREGNKADLKKYDELANFRWSSTKRPGRMALNCLDLPAEYGGTGVSKVTSCLIREELSWGDAGFSLSLGANAAVQAASHSGDGAPAKALCRGAAERRASPPSP